MALVAYRNDSATKTGISGSNDSGGAPQVKSDVCKTKAWDQDRFKLRLNHEECINSKATQTDEH
jgi:hypothetical protein